MMANKTAFLVLGVESSGTRMLTKALISSGCYGDGDHAQRLDTRNLNNLPEKIVLRRSIPHAGSMPDIDEWLKLFAANEYKPIIVKIYRDKKCNVQSMMKRGHAKNQGIAERKFNEGRSLLDRYDGVSVNYRAFVTNQDYRSSIFDELGLSLPNMDFYNGDAKWM